MSDDPYNRKKIVRDWIVSSFTLQPEMVEELNKHAEAYGISRSALIRIIIRDWLDNKR